MIRKMNPATKHPGGPNGVARSNEPRVRLLLVDDHAILRLGIRAVLELEADFDVVGEAGDAEEALQQLAQHEVDVVLLDLALPGRTGMDLLPDLRQRFPRARTLVLTAHADEEYVRASISAGANGYMLKNADRDELLQGIRAVHRGERFLCAEVSAQIVRGYLNGQEEKRPPTPRVELITRRERDVLTRVASGKQNKTIAHELGLSVKTVRKHRQNLMRKLSLHNSAAITAFAIGNGFISPNGAT